MNELWSPRALRHDNARSFLREAHLRWKLCAQEIQKDARSRASIGAQSPESQEKYQQMKDFFGAIDAQVGLGQIYLEQQQPDRASDAFAEALSQAASLEYELGRADANLGLAEAMLMQARPDQALIGAQSAQQLYIDQHNALGSAHADRVLAENWRQFYRSNAVVRVVGR